VVGCSVRREDGWREREKLMAYHIAAGATIFRVEVQVPARTVAVGAVQAALYYRCSDSRCWRSCGDASDSRTGASTAVPCCS
jgi:hypothetical protein